MSTLVYRNARVFVDGFNLSGDHNAVSVALSAEILDETAMGDSTRIHKGGLTTADIEGAGHWDAAAGHVDRIMFGLVGADDKIVSVFPNGLTEGTATEKGFALKGVLETFDVSGDVGSLLAFSMAIRGRGIEA